MSCHASVGYVAGMLKMMSLEFQKIRLCKGIMAGIPLTRSISAKVSFGMLSGTKRPLSVASPPSTTSSKDIPFCNPLVERYFIFESLTSVMN